MLQFLIALVLALAPFAYAQTQSEIQQQIDASSAEIARLQKEIVQLQGELTATSKQKMTLQGAVKEINLNIQKITKSITLTGAQIGQKDLELQRLSTSISTTTDEIGEVREQVADSLRQLGMLDAEPPAFALLTDGTLSSFFDRVTTLAALRNGLESKRTDLSSLKQTLTENKSVVERKRSELAALKQNLSEQKQSLAIARDSQNQLLEETKNKESNYQAIIAQKRAEEAAFEKTLFELASKLGVADAARIPPAISGTLRWPLDLVFITQQFGKTVDATRLYTSGTHDGIDLRADVGTPVYASLGGVVLQTNEGAVKNCQYGKWVIIKHQNGLATLYAHLSRISVYKGQAVDTRQLLGYSGSTGYATGPHLHYTVYLAEAISFKQYTCKSGYTVTIPIAQINAYLNPLSYLPNIPR